MDLWSSGRNMTRSEKCMDACVETRIFCCLPNATENFGRGKVKKNIYTWTAKIYDFYIYIYMFLQLPAGPINIHGKHVQLRELLCAVMISI